MVRISWSYLCVVSLMWNLRFFLVFPTCVSSLHAEKWSGLSKNYLEWIMPAAFALQWSFPPWTWLGPQQSWPWHWTPLTHETSESTLCNCVAPFPRLFRAAPPFLEDCAFYRIELTHQSPSAVKTSVLAWVCGTRYMWVSHFIQGIPLGQFPLGLFCDRGVQAKP